MYNRKSLFLALIALLSLGTTLVIACGFEFTMLLSERRVTLLAPVENNFLFDAAHLLPAPAHKLPGGDTDAAHYSPDGSPPPATDIATVEAKGLSAKQAAQVKQMRAAHTGDAAYALGKDLPEEIRLYTAAAVDFHHAAPVDPERCGEGADTEADQVKACKDAETNKAQLLGARLLAARSARQRFEAVLALPDKARPLRGVWAAYSLARNYAENSEENGDKIRLDKIDEYFARCRQLAQAGAADPLELALDSLGAQARAHLLHDDASDATKLYAEQASHGSNSALSSLERVAAHLFKNPKQLTEHIHTPLVQRLLISYVQAYGDSDDAAEMALNNAGEGRVWLEKPTDNPYTPKGKTSRLNLLVAALEQADIKQPVDADRLAAIAYAHGRFDLAARFAEGSQTSVALWIKAKLGLRAGHQAQALNFYAQALKSAHTAGAAFEPSSLQRLQAEHGTLLLAHGDTLLAFEQLYGVAQRYWLDVAYLAERVLTVDELKQFVDAKVPEPALPKTIKNGDWTGAEPDPAATWPATNPAAQLRDLLARRLMREGRFDQALPYFHAIADKRFTYPEARDQAKAYATALRSADHAWTRIGRAQSLYTAAEILRWHGMEIMGYEGDPDAFFIDGNFTVGTPAPNAKDLGTQDELARFKASAPQPDERYHYRYRAIQLALQAADALPARSETYAEILSNACGWLLYRDEAEAAKIYQRYLKNGAYLDWTWQFGQIQVEPDFLHAHWFVLKQDLRALRHQARQHKPWIWSGIGILALGAAACMLWLTHKNSLKNRAQP